MRSRLFVGVCAEMTSMDNSEVYIAVALSFGLAVCLTVRWWFRRRRILWITAVALGSGYLRDDLLAAGRVSEDQYDRGLNEYDFMMIRSNEKLISRLRRDCPNLLDMLNERVYKDLWNEHIKDVL